MEKPMNNEKLIIKKSDTSKQQVIASVVAMYRVDRSAMNEY
jgi:hypothetical protein